MKYRLDSDSYQLLLSRGFNLHCGKNHRDIPEMLRLFIGCRYFNYFDHYELLGVSSGSALKLWQHFLWRK